MEKLIWKVEAELLPDIARRTNVAIREAREELARLESEGGRVPSFVEARAVRRGIHEDATYGAPIPGYSAEYLRRVNLVMVANETPFDLEELERSLREYTVV